MTEHAVVIARHPYELGILQNLIARIMACRIAERRGRAAPDVSR